MDELEDPVIAFAAAINARLEDCICNLKAGNDDAAIRAMDVTVKLCEQHPAYAVRPIARLGSSLQKVVRGCISNAIAKGRGGPRMSELLVRLDAVAQCRVH